MADSIINLRDNASVESVTTEYWDQGVNISKYGRLIVVSGEVITSKEVPAYTTIAQVPQPIIIQDFIGYNPNNLSIIPFFINGSLKLGSRITIPANTQINFTVAYISYN